LPDKFNLQGPLNGILSAFAAHPGVAWISVPVDMPFIDENIIRFLIEHRNENKIATCFFDSDGQNPEPLLTLWEPSAATLLERFSETGGVSARQFLKTNPVEILKSPDKNLHINV